MKPADHLVTEHIDLWTSAIQAKASTGRGSNKKRELYGIKKLRELILELAVRGKLVPQEPNDEPASILLEQIASEKLRLLKEGKIKKPKVLPKISEDEKPFVLPQGWEWSQLGSVTNYGVCDKAEASNVTSDTWVLELEDVEKMTSKLLKRIRFKERTFKSSKNRFEAGDVIYGKLRPYLDKVLIADESGVCTTEMIPLRAYAAVSSAFLRLIMKSPYFIRYANESTHGMNLPRMGTDKARAALIPIVPQAEQHRIVAKVDELMALCDQLEQETETSIDAHATLVETLLATLTNSAGDVQDAQVSRKAGKPKATATELEENWNRIAEHFDTLFTTEHSIDQLKQTILQLAVMGKLVPQDPNDEPASVLLEKIAAEKALLVKEKKIKKQKALPPIGEDERPFALPEGWEWKRLYEISHQITDGAHHTPTYTENGVPFLSVKDMSSGFLNFSDTRFISEEQHQDLIKRCYPKRGDLLLTKVGTTGIPILVDTDIEFSLFVSVALIKLPIDKIVGEYLSLLVESPLVKQQSEEGTQGVGNKNLVLKTISGIKLAIPPYKMQHRIVAKVNQLMTLCDQLKTRLQHAQQTQLHLAYALVDQSVG